MACFVVPAAEAVVTTVMTKVIKKKEDKAENAEIKTRFSGKLKWLNNMLWGGSALLAFEHLWHGELAPWFPFLTNAADSVSRLEMLREMAAAGVGMSVFVTAIWTVMVAVSNSMEKKAGESQAVKQEV